jgi:hypothetical protein
MANVGQDKEINCHLQRLALRHVKISVMNYGRVPLATLFRIYATLR